MGLYKSSNLQSRSKFATENNSLLLYLIILYDLLCSLQLNFKHKFTMHVEFVYVVQHLPFFVNIYESGALPVLSFFSFGFLDK